MLWGRLDLALERPREAAEYHMVGRVEALTEGCKDAARAIRNLLENALKYGSGSEVVLRVIAHQLQVIGGGPGAGTPN